MRGKNKKRNGGAARTRSTASDEALGHEGRARRGGGGASRDSHITPSLCSKPTPLCPSRSAQRAATNSQNKP